MLKYTLYAIKCSFDVMMYVTFCNECDASLRLCICICIDESVAQLWML